MSAELLWTRKIRRKNTTKYIMYHVAPPGWLSAHWRIFTPTISQDSAGCTECPQKIHFQNDTENKCGVLTNSYFLLSTGGLFIFILCEPGLCYCALLPPDATNFESGYPITIFMYAFIVYFYNISLNTLRTGDADLRF